MLGRIDVVTGPMFSGKSEELIRRLVRKQIAGQEIRVYKPYLDNRTTNEIKSRSGYVLPAIVLTEDQILWDRVAYPNKLKELGVQTVGFDEAQFFSPQIFGFVQQLQGEGIDILISGLDTDYARNPFGCMPDFLALANTVTKLTAVCHNCGADAPYTYRTTDDAVQILVGDSNYYEAACGDCHGRE